MGKLIVVNFMSLDGFYEGPDHDVTALPMDAAFFEYNLERMHAADVVLLGGRSYHGFKGFWPPREHDPAATAADRAFAARYRVVEKVVVSDHAVLPGAEHPWAGTTTIVKQWGAREEILKLKRKVPKEREIVMWGSRTLWTDLLAHGLVDELHLIVGPATLGGGTHLFGDYAASFRRLETRDLANSDSVLLRYEVRTAAG